MDASQNGVTESPKKPDPEAPNDVKPEDSGDKLPELVSKQTFRKKVWEDLEKNRLCNYRWRAFGRIPNFKGAEEAAAKLLQLDEFKASTSVEVNPDKALECSRIAVLDNDKELYVPVPRLKESLLKKLSKDEENNMKKIVSRWGLEHTGKSIEFTDEVHIDLLVVGSVAVSKEGYRIGKGRGYADLEFAILKDMKAIDDDTVIVTTVHDLQVFDELPKELFQKYDVPVDYILTPTQIIKVAEKLPRPEGIFWNLLSNRRVNEMQVLQKLKEKHELSGKDTTLKECDSDTENTDRYPLPKMRNNRFRRYYPRRRTRSRTSEEPESDKQKSKENGNPQKMRNRRSRFFIRSASNKKEKSNGDTTENNDITDNNNVKKRPMRRFRRRYPIDFSLQVSNIEKTVRVRDLKNALIENNIKPDSITWRGYKGFCYLHYAKPENKKKKKPAEEVATATEEEEEAEKVAKPYGVDCVIEVLQKMKISPESNCSLEVKVMEPITRIETTDVTAV